MLFPSGSLNGAGFPVTVGTAQEGFPDQSPLISGLCGETGLKGSCPSWKQLQSQAKPGRVHRRRGLKEEQAGQANPREETTGNEQKMQEENSR